MTVSDDLATLRRCPKHGIPDCSPLLNGCSWNNDPRQEVLDRVEAEIARLEREKQVLVREAVRFTRGGDPDYAPEYQDEYQRLWHGAAARAEAAEAEVARLRDGLRRIIERAENGRRDRRAYDIREIARALLAEDGAAHRGSCRVGSTDDFGEGVRR